MTTHDIPNRSGFAPLRWLTWLLEPHESITDELQRRRAQLLAGMMLVTFLASAIGMVHILIRSPGTRENIDTYLIILGIGAVLVALRVNRAGQVQQAAKIFIAVMLPVFTVLPFLENTFSHLIFFAVLPILISGIFFSVRTMAFLATIMVVVATTLSFVTESATPLLPTFYLILTSGVIYLFIKHLQFEEQVRTARLHEMNQLLRASEETLERRVEERTRDLQVAADVSLQITTQLDSSELLADVVKRTSEAFDLYHVSVFLYDEQTQILRLQQGMGEVGSHMFMLKKQFHITDVGLVPRAAHTRQSALANDVTTEPGYFANPLLPDTRSELAVPIIYGGNLIGVLDVQANTVDRFREEDTRIIRTLADQIAVALRNSQLFEETQAAKDRAEKADQVKSAFLASMSHELRTPLNAIINFSKFLKKGIPGPVNEEQEELIGSISDSGQHLLNLINDVLDMSKIEAGSLKLYVEEGLDFGQIIETAIQYTQPIIAEKPVEIRQELPESIPALTGDRKRLLQIFLNILSNACKFTDEGVVAVRVEHDADNILVAIADTGAGIAPEDVEHVFTAFKQTESGLRQGGGGTGLGMPICQKLVEAHEGRIWFESLIGNGTTFFVELPLQTNLEPQRRHTHA